MQPETLKYAEEMSQLSNCPPASVNSINGKVFRFFHHDTSDERNYLPPAKLQPTRKWKDDEERCDGFGLSMFFSQEKAEVYFSELRLAVPNIAKERGRDYFPMCEWRRGCSSGANFGRPGGRNDGVLGGCGRAPAVVLSVVVRKRSAAVEAEQLGHGGVEDVSMLLGCDPKTIRQGREDLDSSVDPVADRVRKKGRDPNA